MLTQNGILDMVPGGRLAEFAVKQYNSDFQLVLTLYASGGTITLPAGTTASIRGTKADGNGYSADCAVDPEHDTVTVAGNQQLTAAAGRGVFELTLCSENGEVHSANFYVRVEPAALDMDTPASTSVLREFVAIQDNYNDIIAAGRQYEEFQAAVAQQGREASAALQLAVTEATAAAAQAAETAAAQARTATTKARGAAAAEANANQRANQAASSATAAAARVSCASTSEANAAASAASAAASARIAAQRAAEIAALELTTIVKLSAAEIQAMIQTAVTQTIAALDIPNGLRYSADYQLTLTKNGAAIGNSVTVQGGGGGGSGGGTWGSMFGLS